MLLIEQLVKTYAPHKCQFCPEVGAPICKQCIVGSTTQKPSVCVFCDRPSLDFRTCSACRGRTDIWHVWFASGYDRMIKDAIWSFKFHKQRSLSQPLAYAVASTIHLHNSDVVTWVPSAPKHRRQRGYDHAKLLARSVAKQLDHPARSVLSRKGSARQVGVPREKRWQQAKEQYVVKTKKHIEGQRVLLVDDVITSGATLAACAEQLKAAGARSVSAAVVAKD